MNNPVDSGIDKLIADLSAKTSKHDWNDENADPIPSALWDQARNISLEVQRALPKLPTPFFSPDADVMIHVSWSISKTRDAYVEIGQNNNYGWSVVNTDGLFECGNVTSVAEVIEILITYGAAT